MVCVGYLFASVSKDEIPLFGPEMPGSDHGSMRELYENRYKLLRDDNQMLRENLRREQQVETSMFWYSCCLCLSCSHGRSAAKFFTVNSRSSSLSSVLIGFTAAVIEN